MQIEVHLKVFVVLKKNHLHKRKMKSFLAEMYGK
jgi:hypothetical protein